MAAATVTNRTWTGTSQGEPIAVSVEPTGTPLLEPNAHNAVIIKAAVATKYVVIEVIEYTEGDAVLFTLDLPNGVKFKVESTFDCAINYV